MKRSKAVNDKNTLTKPYQTEYYTNKAAAENLPQCA